MDPYHDFVAGFQALLETQLPLANAAPIPITPPAPDAPRALIFSPHPDDEVIIGGLPLRLLRELKINVINVAVTQGSNKPRQAERWKELAACCQYIGFGLLATKPNGLEGINPQTRAQEPGHWDQSVELIAQILAEQKPRVIFFPHERDWNSSHIGTHFLVMDALVKLGNTFSCYAVETEFWGAMDTPNLMVETSQHDLARLLTALSFHEGEVRRNPYHLRLPAWMIDNVRRGAELVGGQGGRAPNFAFATLYRLRKWAQGKLEFTFSGGKFASQSDDLTAIFPSID